MCTATLLIGCGQPRRPEGGSRSFERSVPLEDTAATSASVSIGDLNADGHQDIVLVKGRHWPLDNLLLLGTGSGTFQAARPLGGQPDRSYSGVLADLDADGDLDIVVSNDAPDAKTVHLNDGRGHFTAASTFGRGDIKVHSRLWLRSGNRELIEMKRGQFLGDAILLRWNVRQIAEPISGRYRELSCII